MLSQVRIDIGLKSDDADKHKDTKIWVMRLTKKKKKLTLSKNTVHTTPRSKNLNRIDIASTASILKIEFVYPSWHITRKCSQETVRKIETHLLL